MKSTELNFQGRMFLLSHTLRIFNVKFSVSCMHDTVVIFTIFQLCSEILSVDLDSLHRSWSWSLRPALRPFFNDFKTFSGGLRPGTWATQAGWANCRVHFIVLWSLRLMKSIKIRKSLLKSVDQHSESCHPTAIQTFVPSVVSQMGLGRMI